MISPSVADQQLVGSPHAALRRDAPAGVSTSPAIPAGPSSSIATIAAERQRQIDTFGHTREGDLSLPLSHMPRAARDILGGILDDIQFHKPRAQMRRRAVKAAALLAAFIDRLDAEGAA